VIVLLDGYPSVGYHTAFPLLARRVNREGFNVATLVAPYNLQRRPRRPMEDNCLEFARIRRKPAPYSSKASIILLSRAKNHSHALSIPSISFTFDPYNGCPYPSDLSVIHKLGGQTTLTAHALSSWRHT
jgi:hypothetical protein